MPHTKLHRAKCHTSTHRLTNLHIVLRALKDFFDKLQKNLENLVLIIVELNEIHSDNGNQKFRNIELNTDIEIPYLWCVRTYKIRGVNPYITDLREKKINVNTY